LVKLPICFESISTATVFRNLLDELGYNYKRSNTNRSYTKIAVILALERTALVHRYEIEKPYLTIDIWEEKPNAGSITYIEVKDKNNKEGKKLLRRFTEKLPRKPWEYTFRQKIRNGWLSQGIWNAKKSWKEVIE